MPLYTWIASVLVSICFAGAWVAFESGFAPFGFGSAHQVLDKRRETFFAIETTFNDLKASKV
jgi:hypothetical protein